jgi:putative transposase
VGHRWQGRFKSPAVQCRDYLLSCARYIERNPFEAGLVSQPWDYPWSSARVYALGEENPLLSESAEYRKLAAEASVRTEQWRTFLLREDPLEKAVRRGDWAFGDDEFRLGVAQAQGRPIPRGRGRPRKSQDGANLVTSHVWIRSLRRASPFFPKSCLDKVIT